MNSVKANGRSNGGRFEDVDLEAASPRFDSAEPSDRYMDEFYREVSGIKVGMRNLLVLSA